MCTCWFAGEALAEARNTVQIANRELVAKVTLGGARVGGSQTFFDLDDWDLIAGWAVCASALTHAVANREGHLPSCAAPHSPIKELRPDFVDFVVVFRSLTRPQNKIISLVSVRFLNTVSIAT